jgi:hypothetical protein
MPKHEKPLHWDMSFDEALRRVVQTDSREVAKDTTIKKHKQRKRVATKPASERQPRP